MRKSFKIALLTTLILTSAVRLWAWDDGQWDSFALMLKKLKYSIIPQTTNTLTLGDSTHKFLSADITTANITTLNWVGAQTNGIVYAGATGLLADTAAISQTYFPVVTGTTGRLVNSVLTQDATSGLKYINGNTIYVPIGGSIDTYADAATDGDTLQLASGTYTITATINPSKQVHIKGAGIGKTIVTTSTASVYCFTTTTGVNNLFLSDMTINNTATTGTGGGLSLAGFNVTGLRLENIEMNMSGAGAAYGVLNGFGSDLTMRNVIINMTGAVNNGSAIRHITDANQTRAGTWLFYNVQTSNTANTGNTMGLNIAASDSDGQTVRCYDCNFQNTSGTNKYGVYQTGDYATTQLFNTTCNGATADVLQSGAGTLTLSNTVLASNTTSGAITYAGTVVASNATLGGSYSTGKLNIAESAASKDIVLYDDDVVHPITAVLPTNAFGAVGPISTTQGGVVMYGLSDANQLALDLVGIIGSADPTDTIGAITIQGGKSNGATSWTSLGAAETILDVQNLTTSRFSVLGGGSLVNYSGTAPTTSPADAFQIYSADLGGAAGQATLHSRGEDGNVVPLGMNLVNDAKGKMINAVYGIVTPANVKLFLVFDKTGATTTVIDRSTIGGSTAHNATLSANASTLSPSISGLCPNLNMTSSAYWDVATSTDFNFGSGGTDTAMSVFVLANLNAATANQYLIARQDNVAPSMSYRLFLDASSKLTFHQLEVNGNTYTGRSYNTAISTTGTWRTYGASYSGGKNPASSNIYLDGVVVDDTDSTAGSYPGQSAVTASTGNFTLSAGPARANFSNARYGVVLFIAEELTAVQAARLDAILRSYAGSDLN
jgi:hypothetical protein